MRFAPISTTIAALALVAPLAKHVQGQERKIAPFKLPAIGGAVITPDNKKLIVSLLFEKKLAYFDLMKDEEIKRLAVDFSPGPIVIQGKHLIVADGHWPRPTTAQQNGDRIVRFSKAGEFIAEYGHLGTCPGEFMGPHALAFDSRGRLFVADRSNNRVQIFDKDMHFVDEWRHFGRPSGIAILKDDTLIVADSESSQRIAGPPEAPEGGGNAVRNPGWKNGIRIGSATDGSLKYFIPGTRPEGLSADELGNIFAGLTAGCQASPSGGCLQKFVPKK